jgi:uncharacterized protein (TIGR02265 family)
MSQQFAVPVLDQPLLVEDYIQRVPAYATIKGMFLSNLYEIASSSDQGFELDARNIFSFRDYPLVEQVRLVPRIAAALYPDVSLRSAMLQLGRRVCPTFAGSLIGKLIFSAVGGDVAMLMRAGATAYSISSNVGQLEILECGLRSVRLGMREMFNYVDSYQLGILEGALMMLGCKPSLLLKLDSPVSAEVHLSW